MGDELRAYSSEGPTIPFQGSDKEPLALIGTGPMCQDLREITPIVPRLCSNEYRIHQNRVPRSRSSLSRIFGFLVVYGSCTPKLRTCYI